MIKITINDRTVFLEEPVTVLEAARRAGVAIPTLCHLEGLTPWGGCRLCLVQIEKIPRLQTACTVMAADGMVVHTETEEVKRERQAILEFLLINHPLECPVCDKAGECELQDMVLKYGPSTGRYRERKRETLEITLDPLIIRNMKRCILCTRCVRTCEELQGAEALSVIHRGDRSIIEPFSGGRFDCDYCGNCLSACPVGSLISRLHLHEYRPWMVETVEGICGFCGTGCRLLIQKRGGSIIRTWSDLNDKREPNKGLTCRVGRFGYDLLTHEKRLRSPFIRVGDSPYPFSLEETISKAASALLEIKNKWGATAITGIAGGTLSNEDAYLFGKLIRGIGSNNIDSVARLGYLQAQLFFEELLGPGATANRAQGIVNSELIIVAGDDPLDIAPVFGTLIRQAFRRGAIVLTTGYCPGLWRHSTAQGIDIKALTKAFLTLRAKETLEPAMTGTTPPFEKVQLILKELRPLISSADDKDIKELSETIFQKEQVCLVVSGRVLQKQEGLIELLCLGVIAFMLDARVYLLQEFPNEQGLIDMGLLPDTLPGGRDISIDAWRAHVEEVWKFPLSTNGGKDLYELLELIEKGSIKALYVAGIDLLKELPGGGRIRNALKRLDLLIVQDSFYTETMALAHIGIPVALWPEKEGSYTNFERRIQFFNSALSKRERLPEAWEIFRDMGMRLGLSMPGSIEEIWHEICSVSSLHRGLMLPELQRGSLWPYKGEPLRHTRQVVEQWLSGLKEKTAQETVVPVRPFKIVVEKFPYLSATIRRHSKALDLISEGPFVKMNGETAEALKLRPDPSGGDGTIVRLRGPSGELTLPLKIEPGIPVMIVIVPYLYHDKGLFEITGFSRSVTGAPLWSESLNLVDGCDSAKEG